MKKSLEISAKFDTSDFDKSVDRMQAKLKDLYAPADMIRAQTQTANRMNQMGFGVSGPSQANQERANLQYRKELDRYIGEEYKKQEALLKLLTSRASRLDALKEKQKEMVKYSDEELKLRDKIGRLEETQSRKRQEFRQREESLNAALNIKQAQQASIIQGYQNGGIGGAIQAAGNKIRNNPFGAIGALGTFTAAAGNLYGNYTQSPQRTAAAAGSAVDATVGEDARNIYGRRTAFEAAFNPERSRAAQMALEASRGRRTETATGLAGNILGFGGAGAAAGSALPGIGTAIGGIAGGLYGAYRSFSDPNQRALALSPFSNRYNQEYESNMAGAMGQDYSKNLQNLRMQNPGKNLASQYYEQNYMGNLQSQRGMGMSNEDFYGMGGYLQSGVNAGFTPELMQGASAGILGAGGSSRSAAGNSLLANKAARGMDLTNASQVLGTLSGGIGGAEGTSQAFIKILAEGAKLGLDDSKFAEENRRFTQAAAEIITRSGANTGADFDRVSGGFGRFMGENTNAGIGAAKNAYEQYQQISSSTTGPRGVMRAAGFLRDDKLSQLSTIEKQALLQLPEEQLNESNPLVAGLAEKTGTSVQDFVRRIKSVNEGSVSRFKQADQIRDRLRNKKIDVGRAGDPAYMKSLSSADRADITELMSYQTTELGNQGQREMIARAAGTVGKPEQFGPAVGEGAVNARLEGKGRGEDVTIAEGAKDFGVVLQNFRDFRKEIMPSADAIANFTNRVREMMIVLRNASENEIPGYIDYYMKSRAKTQGQSGKPR